MNDPDMGLALREMWAALPVSDLLMFLEVADHARAVIAGRPLAGLTVEQTGAVMGIVGITLQLAATLGTNADDVLADVIEGIGQLVVELEHEGGQN